MKIKDDATKEHKEFRGGHGAKGKKSGLTRVGAMPDHPSGRQTVLFTVRPTG